MAGYTALTLSRAKSMRRAPTETERLLWQQLRGDRIANAKFRRQQPIGRYIVDFVCQAQRLIVEADGSQHWDSEYDRARDAFLTDAGYRVLRFWNSDIVSNPTGVQEAILLALTRPHPPIAARWAPPSPLKGEGFGDPNA